MFLEWKKNKESKDNLTRDLIDEKKTRQAEAVNQIPLQIFIPISKYISPLERKLSQKF